jgi:hypothetical protein
LPDQLLDDLRDTILGRPGKNGLSRQVDSRDNLLVHRISFRCATASAVSRLAASTAEAFVLQILLMN